MTDRPDAPRPDAHPVPAAATAPVTVPRAEGEGPFQAGPPLPHSGPPAAPPKRPLLKRLFGIGLWGSVKLLALCIVVGFFVMAANFDAGDPNFNIIEALRAMLRQLFSALGWAVQHFWQPALAGALVVLPVWALWRLVSLPWRK